MNDKEFAYWKEFINSIVPLSPGDILAQNEAAKGYGFIIGNENAFELARHLQQDKEFTSLPIHKKKFLVCHWYNYWKEGILESIDESIDYNEESFWKSFLNIMPKINIWSFERIIEEALSNPLPPEALVDSVSSCPSLQKLLTVCHYLSTSTSEEKNTFRISCKQAGEVIGQDHLRGYESLGALCTLGRLQLLERGLKGKKSSLYQYIKLPNTTQQRMKELENER